MLELQRQRLLAKLQQLDHSLVKHPRSDAGAVERRIGRWLGQRIRNSWPGTRNATLQKPIRR